MRDEFVETLAQVAFDRVELLARKNVKVQTAAGNTDQLLSDLTTARHLLGRVLQETPVGESYQIAEDIRTFLRRP